MRLFGNIFDNYYKYLGKFHESYFLKNFAGLIFANQALEKHFAGVNFAKIGQIRKNKNRKNLSSKILHDIFNTLKVTTIHLCTLSILLCL